MCGYVSVSSSVTVEANSQFQLESVEGWRAQSYSMRMHSLGRVGDAASSALFSLDTVGVR